MNYVFKPSLEHIALTKIAVTLWNQDDVKTLTTRVRFCPLNFLNREPVCQTPWKVIEDKVTQNVPKLPLPEPLKSKLLNFIYAIGYEILDWRRYHEKDFHLDRDLPNEICWTPEGKVDKKKTADALIKNGKLGSFDRYRLACVYCLENDIPELWDKIPEFNRSLFYKKDPKDVYEHDLVVFWTYDMKGEAAKTNIVMNNMRSPYYYAFDCMEKYGGNKPATEYFFQKLTHTEREESLVTSAKCVADSRFRCLDSETGLWCIEYIPKEYFSDVLCFLLSQMDEDQQIEVFKSHGSQVLGCFLDWPRQSNFMEMADRMWDFLSEEGFHFVLREIVYKAKDFKDCNYRALFKNFWLESPNTHKKYVIDQWVSSSDHLILLQTLFQIEDIEDIRLILKSATVKEREDIIFSDKGKVICERLACSGRLNSLKFFVQECILSTEVMIKFKKEFKEHVAKPVTYKSYFMLGVSRKEGCGKVFQLIDGLIREKKKRSTEEVDSSAVKRIHSTEFEGVTPRKSRRGKLSG